MSANIGNITGREAFIGNISSRLGRKSPAAAAPEHPFRGAPDFYKEIERTTDEKIELFTDNWTALTGKVLVVDEAEANEKIGAWLQEVAAELKVTQVSRWENEGLIGLGLDEALSAAGIAVVPWKQAAAAAETALPLDDVDDAESSSNWSKRSELLQRTERCQMGIIWPDYAVANTSTLVLQCSPEHGRSVSLLTDILFAVFRADQLVTRMGEAFGHVTKGKSDARQYPSSLNLITGPSRSADIENDLTIGIHGPGKVYAVIIK
ncbi:LutC/YkgG family protein [Paenibacillus radicis (ex Xue et al. 2023)]|uniref:LUD domain-containing protein n=1 Tax=Paenibacillus radicis (ex Xue et al. 2023) TaxID=2972489 RepID=A0ABT1YJE2_9BACL|nr:LUD domain-containing protein [Paenibacillus radicis (ex Xue et al. 2023)]MCR8633286.1 LUD domain-containing protein [Paenibacillus radicis (ex Xue et al. 2023)]